MQRNLKLLPELISDLSTRHNKLAAIMRREKIDAILASSSTSLLYLAGSVYRGYFYIDASARCLALPVRGEAAEHIPACHIRKPELLVEALTQNNIPLPEMMGLEFDTLFHSEFLRLKNCCGHAAITNASPALREARMVKTPYEISLMKVDGLHHVAAYRHIGSLYRENMTDLEFQIEIERVLRKEGSLGFLRTAGSAMEINMGSLIAGPNADTPSPYDFSMGGGGVDLSLPVGADGTMLRQGMTVMVDMNGNFNGYQTDLTRVWRIGNPGELALKAHEVSCIILHELEAMGRPGVDISSLCEKAYEIVHANGLDEYFMGHESQAGFIGHGVGIELNEQPVIMKRNHSPLLEGMTIALEPKFVIPKVGAVGNENTYAVTSQGLLNLTPASPEMEELI